MYGPCIMLDEHVACSRQQGGIKTSLEILDSNDDDLIRNMHINI